MKVDQKAEKNPCVISLTVTADDLIGAILQINHNK